MKTSLILISLISLASFFTISQIKATENLRSKNSYCQTSFLNLDANELEITNTCTTKQMIQISITAAFPEKNQEFKFETQCLQPGETQVFQLDVKLTLGAFSLIFDSETDC